MSLHRYLMESEDAKVKCPVCGVETLELFEICRECGWENDPVQYFNHDYEGGANKMSVNQAKEAYKKCEKII